MRRGPVFNPSSYSGELMWINPHGPHGPPYKITGYDGSNPAWANTPRKEDAYRIVHLAGPKDNWTRFGIECEPDMGWKDIGLEGDTGWKGIRAGRP